ncbi:MAG: CBS domain-containing protein [Planctomycetes bacterium]|jgi:acetoin utilization protein AcuB|nr:CBS domain-containing protein [Planctomycetota bacterium]
MIIADIMKPATVRIGMDETLETVRALFQEYRFHHLLVTERNKLVGVISDRDLLKHISPFINKMAERPQDLATLQKRAHQVMTRNLVTTTREEAVEDAGRRMLEARVSCLPVVDDQQRPVGFVSWRDLLGALCRRAARGARADGVASAA